MSPIPEPSKNKTLGDGPLHPIIGVVLSSDDENDDTLTNDPNALGYQLLPQNFLGQETEDDDDTDEDEDEDGIDFNSLSGIMSALDTHGPNNIEESNEQPQRDSNPSPSPKVSTHVAPKLQDLVSQVAKDREKEELQEVASLWNDQSTASFSINKDKEEEIKNVMSGFKLPAASIPPWAQNISDEEFNALVVDKIINKDSNAVER